MVLGGGAVAHWTGRDGAGGVGQQVVTGGVR
jgi:hypothetical protein